MTVLTVLGSTTFYSFLHLFLVRAISKSALNKALRESQREATRLQPRCLNQDHIIFGVSAIVTHSANTPIFFVHMHPKGCKTSRSAHAGWP